MPGQPRVVALVLAFVDASISLKLDSSLCMHAKENPKLVVWDCHGMMGAEELLDVLTEGKASCMMTTTR